jgi:hypothetical protein
MNPLVTENEFLSAIVNDAGELVWTRDNGDEVKAGVVVGPAVTDARLKELAEDDDSEFSGVLKSTTVRPMAKTTTGPAAPLDYVNAADFGADPGNTGDQTAALNAALTAAGVGGKVRVPNGAVYRVSGTLNIPAWATLEAPTSAFGAGGTAPAELRYVGAGTAMVLGDYATLRHLLVRGPGSDVGTSIGVAGASVILDYVSVLAFPVGVHLTNAYYARIDHIRLQRNATGLKLTGCYNVALNEPSIYGWGADNTPGTGIEGAARPLTVFGGAIETVRYGIVADSNQVVNLFGTYFENQAPAGQTWPATGVFHGVYARDRSKVTVNAVGCMVYLFNMNAFITTLNSTNAVLTARGNHYSCSEESTIAPRAYEVSHGQGIDIGPDNWSEVVKTGASHVFVTGGLPVRGGLVVSSGVVYDGRSRSPSIQRVAHAVAGAITLDASQYEGAIINLSANATGLTISNPAINQEVAITYVQDATGGRAYAFPTTARFNGGTAPSGTAANTRTTVRLRWDPINGRWYEMSRSESVPL